MVNVIGLGYIGLPTALMLASHGIQVVGTDYNTQLVEQLRSGKTTFQEKGLPELFASAQEGGICFTTQYQSVDTYIIAVPTPYDPVSKRVDPVYLVRAMESVLDVCPENAVVIVESTVSPGTIDSYLRPMLQNMMSQKGKHIHLAHAPERIIPGNMIHELLHNNRTIGADDPVIAEQVRRLYASFCLGNIALTDIRTAEMTKVVENTYRAVNIAFANELARICADAQLDVYEIIRICNMHPRVNILQPGPGVGGHCISVDPWFLVGDYPNLARVIGEAMKTNENMPLYVLDKIKSIMSAHGITDPARVGLYGLAYKENVDDCRESPTLQLLQKQDLGYPLKVYDPMVRTDLVPNQYHDLDTFLEEVDLVVLLAGHDEIRRNMDKLREKIVLDTRNICANPGVYRL